MAKTKTITPSSSSSSSSYSSSRDYYHTKSHPFLIFLSFIFILLLLARPADQIRPSNMVSEPTAQTVSVSTQTSPSTLKPRKTQNDKSTTSKQFEANEHEVPSGPNPISNR
ncbi:CLAVATA3/ESR [Bienertia sinuspersici]